MPTAGPHLVDYSDSTGVWHEPDGTSGAMPSGVNRIQATFGRPGRHTIFAARDTTVGATPDYNLRQGASGLLPVTRTLPPRPTAPAGTFLQLMTVDPSKRAWAYTYGTFDFFPLKLWHEDGAGTWVEVPMVRNPGGSSLGTFNRIDASRGDWLLLSSSNAGSLQWWNHQTLDWFQWSGPAGGFAAFGHYMGGSVSSTLLLSATLADVGIYTVNNSAVTVSGPHKMGYTWSSTVQPMAWLRDQSGTYWLVVRTATAAPMEAVRVNVSTWEPIGTPISIGHYGSPSNYRVPVAGPLLGPISAGRLTLGRRLGSSRGLGLAA